MWKKSAPNNPAKPLHLPPPNGQCPYGGNTFQKGASLTWDPMRVTKNDQFLKLSLFVCVSHFGRGWKNGQLVTDLGLVPKRFLRLSLSFFVDPKEEWWQ